MRPILSMLLVLALSIAIAAAPPVLAGPESSREPLVLGAEVPAFTLTDLDGATFDLATARDISEDAALAEAVAAVKAACEGAEVSAETELSSLAGLQGEDGDVDPEKVRAVLQAAGRAHGLIAGADDADEVSTVGDVGTWLTEAATAPIVFMCWSPRCPTSRAYENRLVGLLAETGARFYPLASNIPEKENDEGTREYLSSTGLPYRVLLDRDQQVCDIFGGAVTPHVFVLDGDNRLAYAGSIDDDPKHLIEDEDERQNWLKSALDAVTEGRPVLVLRTRPAG